MWNIAIVSRIFYIDEPELVIWTGSIDIYDENPLFNTITVKVFTVWAAFDLSFSSTKKSKLELLAKNKKVKSVDFWYQKELNNWVIKTIDTHEHIASEVLLINTNGNKNVYEYEIGISQLMDIYSWDFYSSDLKFDINLEY